MKTDETNGYTIEKIDKGKINMNESDKKRRN